MADISVRMGELAASRERDCVLVTIGLGSCIGLALVDAVAGVAGLAHVMLPGPGDPEGRAIATFADRAVAQLTDHLLGLGARRARLEAAIAGGARMFGKAGSSLDVGARNESVTRAELLRARIPIRAAETGGSTGRTIRVYVGEARVTVRTAGGTESDLFVVRTRVTA